MAIGAPLVGEVSIPKSGKFKYTYLYLYKSNNIILIITKLLKE